MMRIITGSARGTRLATLEGETTRPTAERAKEAVFSMLQSVQDLRVLDLFGGSGQLALEALSRGAAHAVLCDRSKEAVRVIRMNAEKTHLSEKCDVRALDWQLLLPMLLHEGKRFDLVFLDPPYALGTLPAVLEQLASLSLLNTGARIVCESAAEEDVFAGDLQAASCYEVLRVARYGAACITVLRKKEVEA
ncbi:MAG: 16S rRNA (guanine(966)-N(2))-methyltransferase RsmD [Ruminococcaceae bacterium]|nr:16S rRNA (guanine(966)-N(2))-methyltransferase RsmD [Oscillospiraceae bacterium]